MLTMFETTVLNRDGTKHPVNFTMATGPGLMPENAILAESMRLAKERGLDPVYADWTWAFKEAH